MKPRLFIKIASLGFLMSLMVFAQLSWAEGFKPASEASGIFQTLPIQKALAELAQAGGNEGACFQTGSMEKCAGCCKDLLDACIALVVPLCHEGSPNRAEFRHCIKGKTDRCESDFGNCAWLCRRTK